MLCYVMSAVLILASEDQPIRPRSATLTGKQLELASFQLEGMKDSRDRLVSGVFRAVGRKQWSVPDPDLPKIDGEVRYYCAFDRASDSLQFHRSEPLAGDMSGNKPSGKIQVIQLEGKYIHTPTRSLHWFGSNPMQVTARGPEAVPSSEATPFDVRCLGLITVYDFENWLKFPKLCLLLSDQELIDVAEEGETICRMVWAYGAEGHLKRSVWLDRKQGYSPIRLEVRSGSLSSQPVQTSETTWTEVSGVWVPRSFRLEERTEAGYAKYELALEWESVNQPIPQEVFTPAALAPYDGTLLVSTELGKPVVLGPIGKKEEPKAVAPDITDPAPRLWASAASLSVLAGVLLTIWVVRRRRLRHSG